MINIINIINTIIILICFHSRMKMEEDKYAHVKLEDLTIIKTLGVGGFGRVELVSSFAKSLCIYRGALPNPK